MLRSKSNIAAQSTIATTAQRISQGAAGFAGAGVGVVAEVVAGFFETDDAGRVVGAMGTVDGSVGWVIGTVG